MAILNNSNAISSGGYDINNSLRFRSSNTAYLNRTPASATNRKTWTWSAWVKRGALGSTESKLFGATTSTTPTYISFSDNVTDALTVAKWTGTSHDFRLTTTQVFRDPSAWYHIVVAIDTTQATASNRVKIYVNGSQVTAFGTSTYPSLNYDTDVSNNIAHYIGLTSSSTSASFDGYMAEVNFIDGQALTPSSFGETDTTTGSWKPKAYSGSYGTNGFYLKFSDIATTSGSNAGLGKDFSGNANYWTTNNISVTAGVTYDAMTDVPTNTSATVANYAVLNPLWKSSILTLAGANLNVTSSGVTGSALSTIAMESGKYYCEATINTGSDATIVGIANSLLNPTTTSISATGGVGYYGNNGEKYVNGTSSAYGATYTTGDIIGIALDITAGTITFYKNNTSQGAITHGLTGPFYFATSDASSGSNIDQSWNFGQRPFSYTPPTGFVALNTFNLPDSTIKKGSSYMDATLYTADTAGGKTITNSGSMQPDLVWIKNRDNAENHYLMDAVRGAGTNKYLQSNTTSAETSAAFGDALVTPVSNGFSITDSNYNAGEIYFNGRTYVGWQWQAGQGTTSSNTSGSITSTVSVNATAGFSVVTYTGTGANATVGHGLGVAPSWIITKYRGTESWAVYHKSTGNTQYLVLNATSAAATASTVWQNTSPTSTVFSVGTAGLVNTSGGSGMVAYCWAEIAGFSKFGSYTGNGSADGPFVHLGFRPKFVMIKRSDVSDAWLILDTARLGYNAANVALVPNSSSTEGSTSYIDIVSNGFKARQTNTEINANGGTYIYMAFAENPLKNSLAR